MESVGIRWAVLGLVLVLQASSTAQGSYEEEAVVYPIGGREFLVHAELAAESFEGNFQPSALPPLGRLLVHELGLEELELSLTQGRWAPTDASWVQPRPAGLEVRAAFDTEANASALPGALAAALRALGGVACAAPASRLLSDGLVAEPALGWLAGGQPLAGRRHFYGLLPQERPCTDDLETAMRALPCRTDAGLGATLLALPLAAAPYRSLGLRVSALPSAAPGRPAGVRWVTAVTARLAAPPQPASRARRGQGWSVELRSALGGAPLSACLLASRSALHLPAPPRGVDGAAAAAAGCGAARGGFLDCDLRAWTQRRSELCSCTSAAQWRPRRWPCRAASSAPAPPAASWS